MKIIAICLLLMLTACGKKGLVCSSSYPSPYMVVFPDSQVLKSSIAPCDGGIYKAAAIGTSNSFLNSNILIRLRDESGNYYLTTFKGQ